MTNLHSNPYALITTRIDSPIVHVPCKPLVNIKRVKDISEKEKTQNRAGVVVYTIKDGKLYFALGIDAKYKALTDFSGGIKYSIENTLTGAMREFQEETLGVFGEISQEQFENSLAVYSETMMTIFIYVSCDMDLISTHFIKAYKQAEEPEVMEIKWLTKRQFSDKIYQQNPTIMYHKVYDLFLTAYHEHGDFICLL